MTRQEVIDSIIAKCRDFGLTMPEQIAYVLATVHHETANTFKPVYEAYWLSDPDAYLKKKPYYPYFGRGYVQLTWKQNYERYATILSKDLVNEPNLALDHETALFILVHGLKNGVFTGRKLEDYINDQQIDYFNARRCVNGVDKADEIADLARRYFTDIRPQIIVEPIGDVPGGVFAQYELAVLVWAEQRGLFAQSDAKSQALKTVAEVGEFCDNVLKGRDCRDDIGDILVTLILQCRLQKTTLLECLSIAYSEIKDRKGEMVNGTFLKDKDNSS